MFTWVERAGSGHKCTQCLELIEAETLTVRVRLGTGEGWYHPACWISMAEQWVGREDEHRGRKKLELSEEQRLERLSLLRKYAAVSQRIRLYKDRLDLDPTNETLRMMILKQFLTREGYKLQIEACGGVPRSWALEPGPGELLIQSRIGARAGVAAT